MSSVKAIIYKLLNLLAQITIWLGFNLLRLSARVYGRDLNIIYKPSKLGAVITIMRRSRL